MLKKLQTRVRIGTLNCMYNIIQPHSDYCITVWGYAPDVLYQQGTKPTKPNHENNYVFICMVL